MKGKRESVSNRVYNISLFTYKWICIIGGISSVLFMSSIFLFFLYYQYTMPYIFSVSQPLYFDYQTPSHQMGEINSNINIHYHIENSDFLPNINGITRPTLPTANFIIPPQLLDKRAYYSFTIHFKFADSVVNRQIGMFMIRMNLKNKEGSTLSTSSRPAIIPQRSFLNRFARDIILLIPTLLGLYEEMYIITVPCIHYFKDNSADPLYSVQVTLSHSEIQLFSSTLYMGTELFGIPYALHHYFVATSFFFLIFFFVVQWSILLCSVTFCYIRWFSKSNRKKDSVTYPDDILIERKISTRRASEVSRNYSEVNRSPLSTANSDSMYDSTPDVVLINKRNEEVGIGDEEHSSEGKSIVDSEIDELEEAISSPQPTVIPSVPLDEDTLIEEAPKKLRKRPPYANRTPARVVNIDTLPLETPKRL